MEPVEVQLSAIFVLFFAGIILGLSFDLYRIFRGRLRPGPLDWLFDLLFWIIVTPIMMTLIFYGNWGDLRVYVLVTMVLGVVFYFRVLSSTVRGWARLTGRSLRLVLKGAGRGVRKGIFDPLLWLWDMNAAAADRRKERRAGARAQKLARQQAGEGDASGDSPAK